MKVIRVKYAEARDLDMGPGSNALIGIEAEVDHGESPDKILTDLRQWVQWRFLEMADSVIKTKKVQRDIEGLKIQEEDLRRAVAVARERWNKAKELLAEHGVKLPEHSF